MSTSYLTMQVTRLLLSLAILLSCFAPTVYCSSQLISTPENRAPGLFMGSAARPQTDAGDEPLARVLACESHYAVAPTAAPALSLLSEGANGKIAITSDRDG